MCVESILVDQKLTASTQTEPMPTRIDRIPLDVPAANTHSATANSAVFAMHSAADPSATEVAYLCFAFVARVAVRYLLCHTSQCSSFKW